MTTAENTSQRMSRRQFSSFLYDLYGCKGKNDVKADALYETDDFMVEVFTNSPVGLMIAVHHGRRGLNFQIVDVMCPEKDAASRGEIVKSTDEKAEDGFIDEGVTGNCPGDGLLEMTPEDEENIRRGRPA